MGLEGKACLITGCSRGIGRAMMELFAKEGAVVYANARTPGCLDGAAKELGEACRAAVVPLYFDVRDSAAAKGAVMRIQKEQGRLDVLVNNAGIMQDALIEMISEDATREVFETNVFAAIRLLQYASRIMKRKQAGSIVNLASIVGVRGNAGQLVYSASKGAVIAMTKTAAKELAPSGIRVNAIAPGMIDTDMYRSVDEAHREAHLANIGMGRLGDPMDVARACAFLASDDAAYITGQVLGVDGSTIV